MRIGFFTSVDGWGGSEVYLKSVILDVRAAGHEVALFGLDGTRLFAELSGLGIPCVAWRGPMQRITDAPAGTAPRGRVALPEDAAHASSSSGRARRPRRAASLRGVLQVAPAWLKLAAGNVDEARRLADLFRGHRVDVMHVNVHGYEMAGLACRLSGIPSVGVYHIWPPAMETPFRRWLIRRTARTYDRLIMPSEAAREAWRTWAGLPEAVCRHVWNGIVLNEYPSGVGRSDARRPVILFVGRLDANKGASILVDAAAALCSRGCVIQIAGEGPLQTVLQDKVATLGLGETVRLLGHVEPVKPFYAAANIFVLPSRSEACPLALMEAMASGLPSVTSDGGAMPQMNLDGVTGWVVPAGDSQALAAALGRLVDDVDLRLRMGRAARERAQTLFARERMIAEMLDVYASLADKGR